MKLRKVKINKYKSFLTAQEVTIEDKITTLVGKNESGKTAFLEALAKVNYFQKDSKFQFDETFDYPKNEWKKFQKGDEDVEVIRCSYELSDDLIKAIEKDLGSGVFKTKEISYGVSYRSNGTWDGVQSNEKKLIENLLAKYELPPELKTEFKKAMTFTELATQVQANSQAATELLSRINEIKKDAYEWDNILNGYIAKHYLRPNLPKFWYFDEYYRLPTQININKLHEGNNPSLSEEELKISKSLFELANINIEELLKTDDFESFISELEATSNEITDQIFEYWSTNQNLEIKFDIETKIVPQNRQERILNIRVRNKKHRVSLPLRNRSRGFIWFFSFIVWFSKIQSAGTKNFILLLDEPGLNLHASAQADLLRFIEEKLANDYQVIYTTHSPFMIESANLARVRTIYDSTDSKIGSTISDVIQEKDPDTLFPLQAALGYDIAQNLYISKNNLLVEGPADLLFLSTLSNILESENRIGLKENITIVPVGGLDKVATFISLLRASNLNIFCLLDSFKNQKGRQKLEDLVKQKIIKEKNIRFYHEFVTTSNGQAEIEDLFEKTEYLDMFNKAFEEYTDIKIEDLDKSITNIVNQINKAINKEHFNHYRPAYKLVQMGVDASYFAEDTLTRFEIMFKEINQYF